MKRKKRNIRRWALWWFVITLFGLAAVFSAEEIGKQVGTFVGKSKTTDPFGFGQVSNIPTRHSGAGARSIASLTEIVPRPRASAPVGEEALKNNPEWKKRYQPNTEQDTIRIQEAILKGDEVELPPGDYLVNQPLRFHSNLKLSGVGVRLIGTGSFKGKAIELRGLEDVLIQGLTFWDLSVRVIKSQNVVLQNVGFVGQSSLGEDSPLLQAKGVKEGFQVIESRFVRGANAPGRGLSIEGSENIEVRSCSFIGAFDTAIEAVGICLEARTCNLGTKAEPKYDDRFRNRTLLIQNNKLHRKGLGQVLGAGINIWGAKQAKIFRNRIHGWPIRRGSACLKLANGEDMTVQHNHCGGLLQLVHESIHPRYLRRIRVTDNTIKIPPSVLPRGWANKYKNWLPGSPQRMAARFGGIIVERNFTEALAAPELMETGLVLSGNKVENGLISVSGIRPGALEIGGNSAALCRWSKELKPSSDNQCEVEE